MARKTDILNNTVVSLYEIRERWYFDRADPDSGADQTRELRYDRRSAIYYNWDAAVAAAREIFQELHDTFEAMNWQEKERIVQEHGIRKEEAYTFSGVVETISVRGEEIFERDGKAYYLTKGGEPIEIK